MLPTGERVPAARRGCSWETRPGVKHPLSPSRETPQKNQKKFVPPEFSVFSAETAAGRGRVSPTPVSRARGGGNPSGTVSAPGAPLSRAWGAVWAGTVRRPGLGGGALRFHACPQKVPPPEGCRPLLPRGGPRRGGGGRAEPCRAVPSRGGRGCAPPRRRCRGSGFPALAAAGPVCGRGGAAAAAAVPAPGPGECGRADGAAGSPLPPCMGGGRLPPRLASPAPPVSRAGGRGVCVWGGGSPPGSGEARVAGSGARLRSPGAALGEEPPPVSPPPAAPRGGGPEPGKLLPCRRGAARPWRSPAAGAGRWGGGAVRGGAGR